MSKRLANLPGSSRSHATWRTASLLIALVASRAVAQENEQPKRDAAKAEAVVLWTALAIVSVGLLGIGLIWGVTRGAKRILKKREPTHTDMPNIWYLNPPQNRRQEEEQ